MPSCDIGFLAGDESNCAHETGGSGGIGGVGKGYGGGCGGSGSGIGPGPGSGRWRTSPLNDSESSLDFITGSSGRIIDTILLLNELSKSLQVILDAIAGRRKKLLLGSPRSFAIVEQLEIQSCAACPDGLEGNAPGNVFAILAFTGDPLIRRQVGDRRVPLVWCH